MTKLAIALAIGLAGCSAASEKSAYDLVARNAADANAQDIAALQERIATLEDRSDHLEARSDRMETDISGNDAATTSVARALDDWSEKAADRINSLSHRIEAAGIP